MRWYQNAVIGGAAMPAQRPHDTSQRRWEELLAPLVPPDGDGRLFLELGCNAGFYLRQAAGLGYRAVGVEKDPAFIDQALRWEREEPAGVSLVAGDMLAYDIPACHVALLASVHYWLEGWQLDLLLARLRKRCLLLIVQGKHRGAAKISPDRRQLLGRMAEGWRVQKQTRTRKHYAVLFRNRALSERETGELYAAQLAAATERELQFFAAFEAFVRQVLSGQPFDCAQTDFAEYLRQGRLRYREMLMWAYARLVEDIRDHGIRSPLGIRRGRLKNGYHRLVIAHVLGIRHLLCRPA